MHADFKAIPVALQRLRCNARACNDADGIAKDHPETVSFDLEIGQPTFSSSCFKSFYADSLPPQKYVEVFASLDGFISAYCKHHRLPAEEATSLFNRLSEHAMLRPEERQRCSAAPVDLPPQARGRASRTPLAQ